MTCNLVILHSTLRQQQTYLAYLLGCMLVRAEGVFVYLSLSLFVFQSGYLWGLWCWAASCSCCWRASVGASVVHTRAAVTSAAAAALTPAAAHGTVSNVH